MDHMVVMETISSVRNLHDIICVQIMFIRGVQYQECYGRRCFVIIYTLGYIHILL